MPRRYAAVGGDDYGDVVELINAGGLRAPPWRVGAPLFRERYSVELGAWDAMIAALLLEVVGDARTYGEAAKVLGLSPEEIAARVSCARGEQPGGLREGYVVGVGTWQEMSDELLLQVVEGARSVRRAAVAMGVPRSTLGARLARARARRGGR